MMKLDVEGYEPHVISGAARVLRTIPPLTILTGHKAPRTCYCCAEGLATCGCPMPTPWRPHCAFPLLSPVTELAQPVMYGAYAFLHVYRI